VAECEKTLERIDILVNLAGPPRARRAGELKIIAAIEELAVIVRILTHLVLSARVAPRSPARPSLA